MKLTRREIQELVELDALCFEPPINYSYSEMKHYTDRSGAILLREYDEGQLTAFCLGDSRNGSIVTIDVHPRFRRHGLGRLLLVQMIEELEARGVTRAISQIALDNLPSLLLHQKMGFEIHSILYGYYPDGSAAYELELTLLPSKKKRKSREKRDDSL